jgi:uncharacterized beta-barrel protein YwiB (DUF1934 family)
MNLKFTSNIEQNGDKFKVAFESKVDISTYKQFTVYEFIDPKTKALNRIEIGDGEVNIFIGQSSMNLVLNHMIQTSYNTPQGEIFLESYLTRLEKKKNKIDFSYILKSNSKKIGEYSLTLELGEI